MCFWGSSATSILNFIYFFKSWDFFIWHVIFRLGFARVHKKLWVCVCVRQRSKKWITCSPKTDSAIGVKFGVLEELILFLRDEFNWNRSCPQYFITCFHFFQKMQIDVNTLPCVNFQLSNWNFNYKYWRCARPLGALRVIRSRAL